MIPKNYWTKEKCQEEALKYNKRTEFQKLSNSAYMFAKKMGIIDEICSHMKTKKPNHYWDNKEICLKEALKYTNKNDYRTKSSRSYDVSRKNGWLSEVCSHMENKRKY